jgi:hypothetical protein
MGTWWKNLCVEAGFVPGGGAGSPGGANTAIQFNNSGSFGGDATVFAYDDVAKQLIFFPDTTSGAFWSFVSNAANGQGVFAVGSMSISINEATSNLIEITNENTGTNHGILINVNSATAFNDGVSVKAHAAGNSSQIDLLTDDGVTNNNAELLLQNTGQIQLTNLDNASGATMQLSSNPLGGVEILSHANAGNVIIKKENLSAVEAGSLTLNQSSSVLNDATAGGLKLKSSSGGVIVGDTGQKIGFYNTTPVTQQNNTNANGIGDLQLKALITKLKTLGLITDTSANGAATLDYQSRSGGTFILSRSDGTAAPVMYISNSAASPNPASTFTVAYLNTDGEFHFDTYYNNNVSSSLVLDVDSHVSLYALVSGVAQGGICTDFNNGDTCIPTNNLGRPAAFSTRFSVSTGLVTKYGGQTVLLGGLVAIISQGSSTLTTALTNFVMVTTNASGYCSAGLYKVDITIQCAGASAGATVNVSVGYTSSIGAAIQASGAKPCAVTTDAFTHSVVVDAAAASDIKVSTTLANSPNYKISFRITAI